MAYFLCLFVFSASESLIGLEMSYFFPKTSENKYTQAPVILSFFLKSGACIKSHLPNVENRVYINWDHRPRSVLTDRIF